ncbi:MAG: methylated-DNA--[protein]-cysteine S-methyltransferase [Parvularculaceae bacterium]
MTSFEMTLFDTALGRCGIAWNGAGVVAVAFPEEDDAKTRARLLRRANGAVETKPSEFIERLIEDIVALLAGEKRDLTYADLDMTGVAPLDREVLGMTLEIRAGETKTYGDIAAALGDISLARDVGQALGRNPFPIVVPCHRVVGADGKMTGFSAPGGVEAKRRLLKIEGAIGPELFDSI